MNRNIIVNSPYSQFEIHQINSTGKVRDSPTSSILKTPTAIFVTTRTAKTKRLTFANGPVDLQSLRNGAHESNVSFDSGVETDGEKKLNNGEISFEESVVEVAISPVKTMKVSPESWKAFLEYKKYNDYANETEKTDYTYSRLSKYRHKEIIPGILIRPNLSRLSITSKRSSFSPPSHHSTLYESNQSKNYDFNLFSHSDSEILNDLNQPSKFVRSKYYLRSSSNDWKQTGEADSTARSYLDTDFYGQSPSEKITKSYAYTTTSSEAPEPTSHYYGKVRQMELDDADIDEVDEQSAISPVYSENRYYARGVERNLGRGAGAAVRPQTASEFVRNFFTTMFLYVTSVGTGTKDLFSKYVLRRQDGWEGGRHDWRSDKYGRLTASGSWAPWEGQKGYSAGNYYSDGYYGRSRSFPHRIYYYFHDGFSKLKSLVWGDAVGYASSGYHDTSRKRRFWWFFIPLLLLAGLWLYKAEQDSGVLSDQYKALDCRTNGLLTSVEEAMRPAWRSALIAYRRAAASASCYASDSWERLKLPFAQGQEWVGWKLSGLSGGSLGFLRGVWSVLWQGVGNMVGLARDALSHLSLFLLHFFTDFISAVNNVLYYISRYFMGVFFTGFDSLGWMLGEGLKVLGSGLQGLWSYLYLLLLAPRSDVRFDHRAPDAAGETCLRQQKSIEKLTSEMNDFKSISWDLSSMKKKIDELELEFRKEKEFRQSQSELFDKQLDDNHKTLQKYQATVNYALHSNKKPGSVSSSSVQYLLDNHSDALKQWIAQNFLLKSDAGLDENKIGLLIAKYTNGTGEELLALKRDLNLFVQNHRNELESLRNNFNTLGTNTGGSDVSLAFIKKLITDAIKLYDADKTGRVDYALETAGGQVESIRCTETYTESPKSYFLMGWPVYTKTSSPRDAISPGMAAGQCWAFVGSQGYLVLQLSHTIKVTGFTMEHISRSLVPRGHIESAPKNFSMWGLKHEHDVEPYLFGEYVYLDNDVTLQYFPVTHPTNDRYKMVELKIASNHGNPNYTCLYRIRVHGDVEPAHL